MSAETIEVLPYTDDGRDPDDTGFMLYAGGSPNVDIPGAVTTHMIPDRRAVILREILNHIGYRDTPIGVGSIFPIGKEDEELVKYLQEHQIDGRTYEGAGLVECFPSAYDVIHDTIEKHGPNLKVAALAPMTDLAKAIERQTDADKFCRIGGLFIQGRVKVVRGRLVPDPDAYNMAQDMEAAERVFALQDRLPFTLVDKRTAYLVPITRDDCDAFARTRNPVGAYFKHHAIRGLECFAERDPETFRRVYNVAPDEIDTLEGLSKPYDVLVAKAIINPAGLRTERVGHHTLIGMTDESPGIEPADIAMVKADLTNTMLRALRRNRVRNSVRHLLRRAHLLSDPLAA